MLLYDKFMRASGLRENLTVSQTPMVLANEIELPRRAMIHHLTDSPADIGMRGSHLLIQGWGNPIRLTFIEDGYGEEGRYTVGMTSTQKFKRAYRQRQKRIRVTNNWQRAYGKDSELVVFDYSLFLPMYKYPDNVRRFYWGWRNIVSAMKKKIDAVGDQRNHFIQIQMPRGWPAYSHFNKVLEEFNNTELQRWVEPSHFWLREIYRTVNGLDSFLDTESNITFVFTEGNNAMVMSLNDLKRRAEEGESGLPLKWYKALSKLVSTRTTADSDVMSEDEDDTDEEIEVTNTVLEDVEEADEQGQLIEGVPNSAVTRIAELGQAGRLTAAEQNRLITIAQNQENLKNPFGEGSLKEAMAISQEDLTIDSSINTAVADNVVPDHAKQSTTTALTRDYIERGLLEKDILSMLASMSNAGVFIQDIDIEELLDAANQGKTLKVKIVPVQGKSSTLSIDIPDVNSDGTFKADSVHYTMDTQKVDIPIRKTSPSRAALTSYMGKLFIQRAQILKHNYSTWIAKQVGRVALDTADDRITNQRFGENAIPKEDLPLEYTAIMRKLTSFVVGEHKLYFNYKKRKTYFGEEVVNKAESGGNVMVGLKGDVPITMRGNGNLIVGDEDVGYLLDVIGGTWPARPRDVAEILLFGKKVPIGLILGYYLGLRGLLKKTKVPHRTYPVTRNIKNQLGPNEIVIRFSDVNLVMDVSDPVHSMLFSGWVAADDYLRNYNMVDLNKQDVYNVVLANYGLARHHIVELDLTQELFVDPITRDILKEMGEPTDIINLMLKCVWLVRNDNFSDETDPKFQRRRGMERIAGFVYLKMVAAIREQRNKPNPANHPVYMGPRDVWAAIVEDPTTQLVKQVNPIHTLKEQEAVSLSGEGGRKAQTLVKRSRAFHENDVGSISEATPDSGKVGIRTYMSANAKTANLRGMFGEFDFEEDGSTSVLSTTSLFLPGSTHDDSKRINLSNVQMSSISPAIGYQSMALRTGYESVIAARLGMPYVVVAKRKGEVRKLTNSVIQIQYEDDREKEGFELGIIHGPSDGEMIPHNVVTDLKKGDVVEQGDVVAWNTAFFERDFFSKKNVVMKVGLLARTALLENNDVLEDGSRIGPKIKKGLTVPMTKMKTIMVDEDQVIKDLVQVGQELEYDQQLCTIEEAIVAGLDKTDSLVQAASRLKGQSPKTKYSGKVSKIEVFHMADPENMSTSVREIVEADSQRRKSLKRDLNRKMAETGFVKRPIFVGGEKLTQGKVAIQIYIDSQMEQGVGDKAVFANQLKSVHGGELIGENTSADGKGIDAFFGYRSVNDRIVNSVLYQGTVNMTMRQVTDNFFSILGDD